MEAVRPFSFSELAQNKAIPPINPQAEPFGFCFFDGLNKQVFEGKEFHFFIF